MNKYNLCVCFAPNFLKSEVLSQADMIHAKTMNDVMMFIIDKKFVLFENDMVKENMDVIKEEDFE